MTPTPKELDKALEKSAKQVLALAAAFGAIVSYASVKKSESGSRLNQMPQAGKPLV